MRLNYLLPAQLVSETQLYELEVLEDLSAVADLLADCFDVVFDLQKYDDRVYLSQLGYGSRDQLLAVERVEHLYQGLFFELPEVDLLRVRVDLGEVPGIHGQEGRLQVKGLRFCEDSEVAVGIVGEVLGDPRVAFSVDVDHQLWLSIIMFGVGPARMLFLALPKLTDKR
jgi:hypothetical protein